MMKRLLCVFVIIVFVSMAFVVAVGNDSTIKTAANLVDNDETTRLDFETNTFTSGHDAATLTFPSPGSNEGLKFMLPGGSLIQSATMDIEGRPYYTAASTYSEKDYSDRSDKNAWYAKNSSAPSNTHPTTLISTSETTSFSTTMYNAIDGDDSSFTATSSSYGGPNPYHLFEIAVNKAQCSYMNITWRGSAQYPTYKYYDTFAKIYVYYPVGHSWVQFDNVKCPAQDTSKKTSIFEVNRDYILNNNIYIIVRGDIGSWGYPYINTAYIKVRAYDRQPNFPTNPAVDLAADGSQEWTATGALGSKATFSGLNFQNALQTIVSSKTDDVEIAMKVSTQSMGALYFSNVSIKYKVNEIPVVNMIPSPIQVLEDKGKYNTQIKLDGFISDDMGYDLLTLEAIGDDKETVEVTFDADKYMWLDIADDFWGEVAFKIAATDWGLNDVDEEGGGDDVTIYSNDVFIQVLPTDDPPVILDINEKEPIPNIDRVEFTGTESIVEDSKFTMYVNATDIDGDEVVLSTNVTNGRFQLSETTTTNMWKIEFTPDYRDVGKKWFEITATEKNNSVSPVGEMSVDLIIEVTNVNDDPVIKYFDVENDKVYNHAYGTTEITVLEDTQVNITMKIFDEDGDYVVLDSNYTNLNFDLDTIDGKIQFSPTQEDVGTQWIGLTLEDDNGGSSEATLKLIVENVNDAPVNNEFTVTGSKSNPLNISVVANEATDEDGDELLYKWNFGDKEIAQGIEVYHDYMTPETTTTYTITLIVSDGHVDSKTISKDYTIQVSAGGGLVTEGPTYTEPTEDWIASGGDRYDTDGDGIPNWWETLNEMDMNDPNDVGIDEMKVTYREELNNYEDWKKAQDTTDPITGGNNTSDEEGKSTTAVVVVVIIAVVLVMVAIIAIVFLMVGKKKKAGKEVEEKKKEDEVKKQAVYSNLYGTATPVQQPQTQPDQQQYIPPQQ